MGKIWVEAAPSLEDGKAAFWERDVLHPDGEIMIVAGSKDAPFRVEETQAVTEAIAQGRLVATSRSGSKNKPEPDEGEEE